MTIEYLKHLAPLNLKRRQNVQHTFARGCGTAARQYQWRKCVSPLMAGLVVFATWASQVTAANQPATQKSIPSRPTADPAVLAKLESLMDRALEGQSGTATVIADLRGTEDPKLVPYFMKMAHSSNIELKFGGLLAANYISHNPKLIDIPRLLKVQATSALTLAIAVLVRHGFITNRQLEQITQLAPRSSQRLMAAAALVDRHQGKLAASALRMLTRSSQASVRYFAALKMVQADISDADTKAGLSILNTIANRPELRLKPLKNALIERVGAEKLRICGPWIEAMGKSKQSGFSTRLQASLVLLSLHNHDGVTIWRALAAKHKSDISRIELGLTAIEYASQLSPTDIAALGQSQSPLLKGVIQTALLATEHRNFWPPIKKLIIDGQPLFLNWCLQYANMPHCPYRSALMRAIIGYATITDGQTGQDYRRAVSAALTVVSLKHHFDRALVARCLKAFNPGVPAAMLAAMLSPKSKNFSSLVAAHWQNYLHRRHRRVRLLAALVLGKFHNPIALQELRHVVLYDGTLSDGLQAQAGWYYAEMTGTADEVLQAVMAYHPKHLISQ